MEQRGPSLTKYACKVNVCMLCIVCTVYVCNVYVCINIYVCDVHVFVRLGSQL